MAPDQEPDRGPLQQKGHIRGLFAAALAGIGGPQQVLLVGELWDSGPRRGLLQDFTRDVFGEPGRAECGGCPPSPDVQGPQGPLVPEHCARARAAPPQRRLRAPLVFALFRLCAVQAPAERRRMREILRDVRQRNGGRRGAVVGVIVLPRDPGGQTPISASALTGVPGPSAPACAPTHPPASPTDLDPPACSAPLGAPDPSAASAPLGAPVPPVAATPLGALVPPAGLAPLDAPDPSIGSAPLGATGPSACSALLGALVPPTASAPLCATDPPAASAPLGAVVSPAAPRGAPKPPAASASLDAPDPLSCSAPLGAPDPSAASAPLGAPVPPVAATPLGALVPPAGLAPLDAPDPPSCSAPLGVSDPSIGSAPLGAAGPSACSALLGALVPPAAPLGAPKPPAASAPLGAPKPPAPLGAPEPILLALLSSVFLPKGSQHPSDEGPLQTALYQPGDPRSALGVMEAACRALRAADPGPDADAEDELKIPTILKCFPWKRRRRKSSFLKAGKNITGETPHHPEEGIALKALCELSNGACEESHTDT